jgi:hypothetical protein
VKKDQNGFTHPLYLLFFVIIVAAIGFAGWRVYHGRKSTGSTSKILTSNASPDEKAVAAGKNLSGGHCSGSGETTFTHLPMNASDFGMLIPYGVTIGGHVTPVDHQYFSPTIFNSPKDKYPVYAMADSTITGIEVHPPENGSNGRIRLIFTVSCTFLYYYDLVTSVEPGIDAAHLPIAVKAGQLIGHIGGQTLDFAVWNTKKPLSGFINPASYDAEAWKIFTADPFPYFRSDLRQVVESKDPRTVEPIAGKIDYDIDGKLIGNWFLGGSGGYHAQNNQLPSYWAGHLSIAPDLYDPSATVVSVGNYNSYPLSGPNFDTSRGDGSDARQYFAKASSPDPAKVDQSSGAVKFELVMRNYRASDGSLWTQASYTKGPKADNSSGQVLGTILVQLTGKQSLKFEVFRGKTASQVSSFDSNAKNYTR